MLYSVSATRSRQSSQLYEQGGFTLIELSIVLVIIGLIIGGVLVGRDMINAAQLRSVHRQIEQYNAAVNTFKGKYNCLPGDCPYATTYFGTASGGCPYGSRTGFETCNGNGNGILGGFNDSADQWAQESYLVWQHLANAQLIGDQVFTGVGLASQRGRAAEVGTNVPALKGYANRTGVYLGFYNADYYSPAKATVYMIGQDGYVELILPIMRARDVQSLDSKYDDGIPNSGRIQAHRENNTSAAGSCTNVTYTGTPGNQYNYSGNGPCGFFIFAEF